jgi:hypothetical protein
MGSTRNPRRHGHAERREHRSGIARPRHRRSKDVPPENPGLGIAFCEAVLTQTQGDCGQIPADAAIALRMDRPPVSTVQQLMREDEKNA